LCRVPDSSIAAQLPLLLIDCGALMDISVRLKREADILKHAGEEWWRE